MCISPICLKRTDASAFGYSTNRVPCGKCYECLGRRQKGWTFRLMEEAKISKTCAFITLTYEDTPYSDNGLPTLDKTDWQKFMKRLRKRAITNSPIKYYACGEYGSETHRPHYHAIMFNMPYLYTRDNEIITEVWGKGNTDVAEGNESTMRYVTKYIMKSQWKQKQIIDTDTGELIEDDRQREFSLMSKGMGKTFLTPQMVKFLKADMKGYVTLNGAITALPRYYRDKVYSDKEKFLLNMLAEKAREEDLLKKFKDDPFYRSQWINQQIRIHEQKLINERQKL